MALASARHAQGKRSTPAHLVSGGGGGGGSADDDLPKPKTLVEIKEQLVAKEKAEKKGKQDWQGDHPWKPWDREKDLVVRKEKSREQMLNDPVMGKLNMRFGGGRRETTFM